MFKVYYLDNKNFIDTLTFKNRGCNKLKFDMKTNRFYQNSCLYIFCFLFGIPPIAQPFLHIPLKNILAVKTCESTGKRASLARKFSARNGLEIPLPHSLKGMYSTFRSVFFLRNWQIRWGGSNFMQSIVSSDRKSLLKCSSLTTACREKKPKGSEI